MRVFTPPTGETLVKLETPHDDICLGRWGSPNGRGWEVTARQVRRDRLGRSGTGTTPFVVLTCVDVRCPGQALVRASDIAAQATRALAVR